MNETPSVHTGQRKSRGALSNKNGRFEDFGREETDDGWGLLEQPLAPLRTRVEIDSSKTIVSHNDSPDIPFTSSINPYRGCEHGCIYCFARPTHTYLGLSAGMDFETRLFYKPNAAKQLRTYLSKRGYPCDPITLGANTDPYQPIERRLKVTRSVLEVLHDCHHPVSIVTKNATVERDLDLLGPMAEKGLAQVFVSVTTLDSDLARRMEPRTSSPQRRLRAISTLTSRGVPVSVLMAPIIPFLNDREIETLLEAVHSAGARTAGYSMLRLPLEIENLFTEWLFCHYPLKAARILNRIRDIHGGKIYDSTFGVRQRGQGEFARLTAQRFKIAKRRLGFTAVKALDRSQFIPPAMGGQYELF